jgi:hypothetical protein
MKRTACIATGIKVDSSRLIWVCKMTAVVIISILKAYSATIIYIVGRIIAFPLDGRYQ